MGGRSGSPNPEDASPDESNGGDDPGASDPFDDHDDRPWIALFEAAPDAALVVDPEEYRVVAANQRMVDLVARDRDQLVGTPIRDLHPGDGERYEALVDQTVEFREVSAIQGDVEGEFEFLRPDGSTVPVEASSRTVEVDGKTYLQSTFREVRDRTRREQILERLHGATRRLLRANDRQEIASIVGNLADEVLGLPLHSVMLHDPDRNVLEAASVSAAAVETFEPVNCVEYDDGLVWKTFERGEPLVYDDVRTDPDVYNPETEIRSEFVVPIGDHGVFLASSTEVGDFDRADVSLAKVLAANAEAALDRLQRQRELDEQTRRLRTIVDNAPIVLFSLDPEGRFTLSEGKALQDLGLELGEAVGESLFELFAGHETILTDCQRALDGEAVDATHEIDGQVFETWFRPVCTDDDADQALTDGDVVDCELKGVIGAAIEVTERERRERLVRVLNRFLRHNLRNAMNVMVGYAERLDDHDDPEIQRAVEEIETTGDDLTRLSEKARRLSQMAGTETTTGTVDARGSLEQIVDALETAYGASIELDGVEGERLPVDEQVELAFREVCENAVKHGDRPDPTAHVTVGADEGRAHVEVEDDGPGIPDQERAVLETEGETPLRHGSGLGLFVAYWAISDAGGHVEVEDATEEGTVLTVSVPLADHE